MEGQVGARVMATKHWSKGDQISSLIGKEPLTNKPGPLFLEFE